MNYSGDQDSGVDLQTNDQIKLKTANTDRVTVTDATTTVANDLAAATIKTATVKHTGGTTGMAIDTNGLIVKAQTPIVSATKNSTTQNQTISGTNHYVITGLDSGYLNSHSVNNKSYFDSSTSRYTNPSGNPQIYVHATLTVLFGITKPGSGTNWGLIAIRKNDSAGLSNNYPVYAYREINSNSGGAGAEAWETLNCTTIIRLNAGQWVEPTFSGSAGVLMRIHSGVYTNFTVAQIA